MLVLSKIQFQHYEMARPRGEGGTQLFLGRGVRPGFPKWRACERIIASERGGL